jgi:hypothetical protein
MLPPGPTYILYTGTSDIIPKLPDGCDRMPVQTYAKYVYTKCASHFGIGFMKTSNRYIATFTSDYS